MENKFNQTIGFAVDNWTVPQAVQSASETQNLQGQYCQLTPLKTSHAPLLLESFTNSPASLWTYMAYGPFNELADYENWVNTFNKNNHTVDFSYLIQSKDQQPLGICSFLRITPEVGSIEIGNICFSPTLQKTPAATEVIFLMIDAIFKLGYRRCEWKCNDLNLPSIAAAKRYGFKHEGTFRQAMIVKGNNRDTAWFSILDHEWKKLRPCFIEWLAADNFDDNGKQLKRLSELTIASYE